MNEDKVVPNIRFMGFKDKWKAVKINYIVNIKAGGDLEKNKLLKDGKYPVIGNTLKNNGIIGYTNTFKIDAPAVTVTGRGEIGKAFYQPIPFTPVVRLLALVPKNGNIDMKFLSNEIENLNFFSESTGVPQLTAPELGTYKVGLTECNEQQKIGDFFTKLDKLLDLQQQKIDKLELLKKAFLQKLFPKHDSKVPELRFKGYDQEWEEKKFSSLYKKCNEKNNLSFSSNKIISVANMYYKKDNVKSDDNYMRTYNIFRLGDIAFEGHKSKKFTFGRFVENTIGDGIVSHVFEVFRPISNGDITYWKYAIHNEDFIAPVLMKSTVKATMMNNLIAKDFLKQRVPVPQLSEQQKIGNLLSKVDQLIELENKKLQNFQQLKKCLLQNMFVK